MSQAVPGIGRNRCPLCGELTRVPWHRLLFRRSNHFRCSACNGSIIVTERTSVMALLGGIIGMVVGIWVAFRLVARLDGTGSPSLSTLILVGVPFCAFIAGGIPLARWNLKLEAAARD
jgi:hypothetical protein